MNFRLVSRTLGSMQLLFTSSMLTMVPFAVWYREWDQTAQIIESLLLSVAISGALLFYGRRATGEMYRREALAIVGVGWLLSAALGALPFLVGGMVHSYVDAYFEAMSGLTTTGASILRDVESVPRTLLFWRSFLHFIGGLGIIVFVVAILPVLGVGGKALYKQEVPGPVPEGLTPRIKDTAYSLCKVYIFLNVVEIILLKLSGMTYFEAINHALATMATGGFSTKNTSILGFGIMAEWVIILFMAIAGMNFTLHLRFAKGDYLCYFKDPECRAYAFIVVGSSVFFALMLYITANPVVSHQGALNLRDGFFATLTVLTTTGFATVDFDQWPPACRLLLVVLMFIGGMAGSTAGGLKVIRCLILAKSAIHQVANEAAPREIRVLKLGGKPVDRRAFSEAFTLFFLWIIVWLAGALIVTLLGPSVKPWDDLVTGLTASAACLNNIGPGLEAVGPTLNFAGLHPISKAVLSLSMVMGRLELYVILVIMNPRFWRR